MNGQDGDRNGTDGESPGQDLGQDPDADADIETEPKATTSAEALLDTLVEEGVLAIDDRTGTVTTTAAFEDAYEVYLDTYRSVSREEFVRSVAEVFGLDSTELAARRIEDLDVTREQLAAYLGLRAEFDGSYDAATLSRMAVVVADLEPETPVPESLELLDDETAAAFVADHDRAMVTVWARRCDPCETMKQDLGAIFGVIPEGIAIAGIDGDRSAAFCTEHGVDAAPAVVYFESGDHCRTTTGRKAPDDIEAAIENVYG